MEIVLLTALGVGGASVIGALFGFVFKKTGHRFSDIILSFAAGVMLAAAVVGLVLPSLEYGGKYALLITIVGVFCGAFCVNLIDKVVPHLHRMTGVDQEAHPENNSMPSHNHASLPPPTRPSFRHIHVPFPYLHKTPLPQT